MSLTHLNLLAALLLSLSGPLCAQQVAIIEHPPLLKNGSEPADITVGSDGSLWFTETGFDNGNRIGRITTAGALTEYPVPTRKSQPFGITAGPDGALWFTEFNGNRIGRITTGGVITEYLLPNIGSHPDGITTGPDGALWFAEDGSFQIGRITTDGAITEYLLPDTHQPLWITTGPDGALWFTELNVDKIGRITTGGVITEYSLPFENVYLGRITAGPDGALWFTESGRNRIGRITTAGVITEYLLPNPNSWPDGITAGPDGALWFTENDGSRIGRITTEGAITEYPAFGGPAGITQGPDGTLWFTDRLEDRIGQVVFPTAVLTATPESGVPGSTVTLTGSGFASGESINIYAGSTGTNLLGSATADSSGGFVASSIGRGIYGLHSIVGVGQNSARLGVTNFFVIPRLVMDPLTGPVGSTVTAQGYGFGPNVTVMIYWNTPRVFLGYATANRHGSFSGETGLSFVVPAGAPSGPNLVFGRNGVFGAVGKGYFTVE